MLMRALKKQVFISVFRGTVFRVPLQYCTARGVNGMVLSDPGER